MHVFSISYRYRERGTDMTQNPIFRGAATALVTPTTPEGVDYDAFGRLIDWQIEEGIDALVILGTSGECSTFSDDEHRAVLDYAIRHVDGRVPVIAGSGSNDTAYALAMTDFACRAGADGLLVVTPYYNKVTQNGLIKVFTTIADHVTKPIIIYNVPSRTGVNIEPKTYAAIADHPMIAGIKEANNDISKIVETVSLVGGKVDFYSGNDDQIIPFLSLGGAGVISVLSNIMPRQTAELCRRWFEGDYEGSLKMQCDLYPLIKALFCEVNPIPVKAAVSAMGFCENYMRLPLTPLEPDHEKLLFGLMRNYGLLK